LDYAASIDMMTGTDLHTKAEEYLKKRGSSIQQYLDDNLTPGWCALQNVPGMCRSNESEIPYPDFQKLDA